jgi:hypothetical protein
MAKSLIIQCAVFFDSIATLSPFSSPGSAGGGHAARLVEHLRQV